MNEEEKKAIEILKEIEINTYAEGKAIAIDTVLKLIKKLQKENEDLKSDNLEYQRIQDIFDKRTYRKKYLEERRKEEPDLLYPDSDEIYQRYYELKQENEELKAKWDKDTHILQNKLDYANADRIDLAQQNKELRKENNGLEEQVEYDKTHIYTPQTIELNFISKSKIEDKLEEIQKEYNKLDKEVDEYINDANKDLSKYYENKEKIGEMQTLSWCIDNLQELLQFKK